MFCETVKEIQDRLGDDTVGLDSFIISNTPSHVMESQWGVGKAEMVEKHILFQDEDHDTYVRSMLTTVLAAAGAVT